MTNSNDNINTGNNSNTKENEIIGPIPGPSLPEAKNEFKTPTISTKPNPNNNSQTKPKRPHGKDKDDVSDISDEKSDMS